MLLRVTHKTKHTPKAYTFKAYTPKAYTADDKPATTTLHADPHLLPESSSLGNEGASAPTHGRPFCNGTSRSYTARSSSFSAGGLSVSA